MILPIHWQNAREAAYRADISCKTIAVPHSRTDIGCMTGGSSRVSVRNSVFRYPSPCGWSGCVPIGSPVFSSEALGSFSLFVRATGVRLPLECVAAPRSRDNERLAIGARGKSSCKKPNSRSLLPSRRWPLRPVATRPSSKAFLAPVPASVSRLLPAVASPAVPSLVLRATSPIARPTPANANNHTSVAPRRGLTRIPAIAPGSEFETIGAVRAGGFFVANATRPDGPVAKT